MYKEDLAVLMVSRAGWLNVPCPGCGYEVSSPAFVKDGFEHVICDCCDTLYITPRPPLEKLLNYYRVAKSIKHWNDVIFPATEEVRRREIFVPRAKSTLRLCFQYDSPREKLVDVGAGYGTFLDEMKYNDHFAKLVAVEPCHELAESCRERGLEVLEGGIEEVDLEGVSVITAFEMIEHLFCPRDFLKVCYNGLADGGLLIMTTPNIKGFDLAMLGAESDNIGGPNHLQYFHPNAMAIMLERASFEWLSITTPGELDVDIVLTQMVREGFDAGPFLGPMLKDVVPREAFQRFLAENCLSSHMVVVARKA